MDSQITPTLQGTCHTTQSTGLRGLPRDNMGVRAAAGTPSRA